MFEWAVWILLPCSLFYLFYVLRLIRFGSIVHTPFLPDFQAKAIPAILTVAIPYRNASDELAHLIQNLLLVEQITIEILLVDDYSDVPFSLEHFPISHISLKDLNIGNPKRNNKKISMNLAMERAKSEFVLFLDADIAYASDFFDTIIQYLKRNPSLVLFSHHYSSNQAFWDEILALEQLILLDIGIIAHRLGQGNMCHGAAMLIAKEAYFAVQGFEGLYDLKFGDDMLIYHRILEMFPKSVYYDSSPNAFVISSSPRNLLALIKQRIRWSYKNFDYERKSVSLEASFIALVNFLACFSLFFIFWDIRFLGFYGLKVALDFCFGLGVMRRYKIQNFIALLLLSLVYPFYVTCIVIFTLMALLFF
jgi:cellulose synthase/poly-beta-1,6-N-acetylglucosamine synthase-like glycosyltransferase